MNKIKNQSRADCKEHGENEEIQEKLIDSTISVRKILQEHI